MKIDLISRQGAIKAIENCTGIYVNNLPTMINKTDAYKVLTDLPSAQPDLSGYSDRLWKAAYERGKADAQQEPSQVARDIATIIENEQDMRVIERNDIVRCKDCKHNPKDEWFGCPMSHLSEKQRPETAWCWKGERRTE